MKRAVTAFVAGSIVVAGILLLESWVVFAGTLVLFEGCAVEYVAMGRRIHADLPRSLLLIAMPAVALSRFLPPPFAPPLWPLALLAAGPLAFAVLLLRNGAPSTAAGALGWLSFGLPYLVLPVWSAYQLHQLNARLFLVFLVAVWSNDTVAFLVGSTWGRRKLAPQWSPNKTWEGALAGWLGGVLSAVVGLWWISAEPRWPLLGIIAVTMIAAQLGDLVESMLKRAAQVKDSGTLAPGHGGLLDRLDAIILAMPVFLGLLAATGAAGEL
jgi:phosphatidate cytidylyltransferase